MALVSHLEGIEQRAEYSPSMLRYHLKNDGETIIYMIATCSLGSREMETDQEFGFQSQRPTEILDRRPFVM